MPPFTSLLRSTAGLAALAAGSLAFVAPASADDDVVADAATTANAVAPASLAPGGSAADCVAAAISRPFSGLGDDRDYVLAPGGDFSPNNGWLLGPGARIVPTDEHGGATGSALTLAPGAIAVSPPTCVDLDYPTARVWSRGGRAAGVAVLVTYADGGRVDRTKVSGRVAPSVGWAPSGDLDVRPEVGGATAGWRRVTFTLVNASPLAPTQIDDLYVDPRMH